MEALLKKIAACERCSAHLPLGPRPVVTAAPGAKIALIGQAPGTKVHNSGIPWDDASGKQLRAWMSLEPSRFYNPDLIAIIPMGFCYPGKGPSGDLPPRPECAPLWHAELMDRLPNLETILLIGSYAQKYYLGPKAHRNLTETVRDFQSYGPRYFPLPHPSPRNRIWLKRNPWFEKEVIPHLKNRIHQILEGSP